MNRYEHETIMSNDRYDLVRETYKDFGRTKIVYYLIDKEIEDWLGPFKEIEKARTFMEM